MPDTLSPDTIAAIATPPGSGAIGVVRLSGPAVRTIAGTLFRPVPDRTGCLQSHHLYHGIVFDPADGCKVDEVMLAFMRGPRTYTGEDCVEIHCHGGTGVLHTVLELTHRMGARPAAPGEFTRRAFLNGRIDLPRAEAVIDIINAQTGHSVKQSARQLCGELSRAIEAIRTELIDVCAEIEACIDFPDEDIEIAASAELTGRITGLHRRIAAITATYRDASIVQHGVRAVIVGKPNAGKSSLFNALLGSARAIVTPTPGTTRDTLSETILVEGILVSLHDTAGIHSGADPIEKLGIDRAMDLLTGTDIVVCVFDGSRPADSQDQHIRELIADACVLHVINKCDLPRRFTLDVPGAVSVSALQCSGIDELKRAIAHTVCHSLPDPATSGALITNARHKAALEGAGEQLLQAAATLGATAAAELAAVDLQSAIRLLGEITGHTAGEDVLDRVFSRFCIGK